MANIIGTIKTAKIGTDCKVLCSDGGICGDAHDEKWRCADCDGEILGKCLHIEMKIKTSAMVWEGVDEMCTACGKCNL